MSKKLDILSNLLDEVYNAKDLIDSRYNPKEYPEWADLNEYHEHTLTMLNNYMSIIKTMIKL